MALTFLLLPSKSGPQRRVGHGTKSAYICTYAATRSMNVLKYSTLDNLVVLLSKTRGNDGGGGG